MPTLSVVPKKKPSGYFSFCNGSLLAKILRGYHPKFRTHFGKHPSRWLNDIVNVQDDSTLMKVTKIVTELQGFFDKYVPGVYVYPGTSTYDISSRQEEDEDPDIHITHLNISNLPGFFVKKYAKSDKIGTATYKWKKTWMNMDSYDCLPWFCDTFKMTRRYEQVYGELPQHTNMDEGGNEDLPFSHFLVKRPATLLHRFYKGRYFTVEWNDCNEILIITEFELTKGGDSGASG